MGARVRGAGEDRPLALYLWFFHREQFLILEDTAPTGIGERLRRWLVDTNRYGNPTVFYGLAVDGWLLQHDVPALDTALLTGRARTGQLVGANARGFGAMRLTSEGPQPGAKKFGVLFKGRSNWPTDRCACTGRSTRRG